MTEDTAKQPQEQPVEEAQASEAPVNELPGEEESAEGEAASQAVGEEAEEAEDDFPPNQVTLEDVGTLRKKVTIEVPRERIDAKFDQMFGELATSAQVPGFRVGHAPRRLIEKRFGREIGRDVRNAVIGKALGDALAKPDLRPIGEPDLKLEEIELPEEGNLVFSFEVEVAPEFELPDYKGIAVKRPVVEVTDEHVDEALRESLEAAGTVRPADRPARHRDFVTANVSVTGEGIDYRRPNAELRVAPAEIEGVLLEDLPAALAGKSAGEEVSMTTTVSPAHPNEAWRGKQVSVAFHIKEVKALEPAALDEDFARRMGFDSVAELREALRIRFQDQVDTRQQRLMRDQVRQYLLRNTRLEVPEGLAARQAEALLARRVVDLMLRGVARERIEQNMQELRAATAQQAAAELKLSFILEKIADGEDIKVEDEEVNARIAQMASGTRRRPERIRQEMTADGSIQHLTSAIREEKAIDRILESAGITDVTAAEAEAETEAEAAGEAQARADAQEDNPQADDAQPKP